MAQGGDLDMGQQDALLKILEVRTGTGLGRCAGSRLQSRQILQTPFDSIERRDHVGGRPGRLRQDLCYLDRQNRRWHHGRAT
jgi:hypothetical protein